MGWPKGRPRGKKKKPIVSTPTINETDDLKTEIEVLKAALKQLIRENKSWRLKVDEAIKLLNLRVDCPSLDVKSGDSGAIRGLRPVPDDRSSAVGIRAGSGFGSGDGQLAANDDD